MPYSLEDFRADLKRVLNERGTAGLPDIAGHLSRLVAEPTFAMEAFGDSPPRKRELFHDTQTDVHVLAHVHEGEKIGPPHSHGASWAIYGTVKGITDMTEWRRINPDTDDHAELAPVTRYRLGPGDTRGYGPHAIHSTAHPVATWVIRITGTNLDVIPRYRFRPLKDKLLETA